MSISHRKPYVLHYYIDGKEVSYERYKQQESINEELLKCSSIGALKLVKRLFIRRIKE